MDKVNVRQEDCNRIHDSKCGLKMGKGFEYLGEGARELGRLGQILENFFNLTVSEMRHHRECTRA